SDPALNLATVFAAILIVFLVCGLIPFLALLFEVEKVPNPTKETLSPFFKDLVTFEVNESKAFFAAALDIPARSEERRVGKEWSLRWRWWQIDELVVE